MKTAFLKYLRIVLVSSLALAGRVWAEEVELKFVVKDEQIDKSRKEFPPVGEVENSEVYFLETADSGLSQRHVILRLRNKLGKHDDSTVKLRGDEAEGVPEAEFPRTNTGDEKCKLERDKLIGGKETPSLSITLKQGKKAVAEMLEGKRTLESLFSEKQKKFLAKYAPGVNWQKASLLGPVKVTEWEFEAIHAGRLTAELWDIPQSKLRALEFSTKVDKAEVDKTEKGILDCMEDHKIEHGTDPKSKTQFVIDTLLKQGKPGPN